MTRFLDKNQVAEVLGVKPRKAAELMMEMNPTAICGTVRKRYRVSEENLNRWLARKTIGRPTGSICTGSNKKLARR